MGNDTFKKISQFFIFIFHSRNLKLRQKIKKYKLQYHYPLKDLVRQYKQSTFDKYFLIFYYLIFIKNYCI